MMRVCFLFVERFVEMRCYDVFQCCCMLFMDRCVCDECVVVMCLCVLFSFLCCGVVLLRCVFVWIRVVVLCTFVFLFIF